jgi:hypothetical protein
VPLVNPIMYYSPVTMVPTMPHAPIPVQNAYMGYPTLPVRCDRRGRKVLYEVECSGDSL